MNLLEYRKQRRVSFVALGRLVDANPHSLSQIAHGRRRPSWRLAGLIQAATGGAVPRSSHLGTAISESRATDVSKRLGAVYISLEWETFKKIFAAETEKVTDADCGTT
jgi:hypothetical protein